MTPDPEPEPFDGDYSLGTFDRNFTGPDNSSMASYLRIGFGDDEPTIACQFEVVYNGVTVFSTGAGAYCIVAGTTQGKIGLYRVDGTKVFVRIGGINYYSSDSGNTWYYSGVSMNGFVTSTQETLTGVGADADLTYQVVS